MQDTTRSAEIQMVFSGQKLDSGMGSIRQGTSITSVSSVGSYTFQVHYRDGKHQAGHQRSVCSYTFHVPYTTGVVSIRQDTSITSVSSVGSYSFQVHYGMGSIRQGTSITSVSSVGSYTFQVHYC
jgi:hypothetical protein